MIIVKLMGGLGNQMFQYAAARRLAMQHNSEVVLDDSYFSHCPPGDTPRTYELGHLTVKARFATPLEIAELRGVFVSNWQRALVKIRRLSGLASYSSHIFQETNGHFCSEVLTLPDNIYLFGFWQSECYFIDIAETIREDFEVKSQLQGKNREVAYQIQTTESVAVHFRRGDYVTNPKTAAYHGVLNQEYYQRAIELLCKKLGKPQLFIFSDDPEWVRNSITFPVSAQIVDHNPPQNGYEDLRLMSLCKHAIIANSSFSWWGAWLNRNPGKIVIAPQRWVNNSSNNLSELLPATWLRVEF